MKWSFPKVDRIQPAVGKYSDWKDQIASDCDYRCVYCAIPESRHGGVDNFHVEHYRPYSLFPDLENIIGNLYLSCPICNRFKSNDWPNEPIEDCSCESYVDPGSRDYNELFSLDSVSFEVTGNYIASNYIKIRLYLNRPQLIRERRHRLLMDRLDELSAWYQAGAEQAISATAKSDVIEKLLLFSMELLAAHNANKSALLARPYGRNEVKKA